MGSRGQDRTGEVKALSSIMKLTLLLLLIGLCAISWHNVIAENDEGAIDQQVADNEQELSSKDAVIPDAEGQDSNDDESGDEDENLDESQDDENPEDLANANEDTSVSQVKDPTPWFKLRRRYVVRRRRRVVRRRRRVWRRRRRVIRRRRRVWRRRRRVSRRRRRAWRRRRIFGDENANI